MTHLYLVMGRRICEAGMKSGKEFAMDKIYRRPTQSAGTTKKRKDEKARKRNVIMNFRVSAQEKELIDKRIALSGLSKSEFFIQSCMYQKILVKGNVRTFDEIKKQMATVNKHLSEVENAENLQLEVMESLRMIAEILDGFYGSH
jgi:uncharacterized protein (DUF1778 family)